MSFFFLPHPAFRDARVARASCVGRVGSTESHPTIVWPSLRLAGVARPVPRPRHPRRLPLKNFFFSWFRSGWIKAAEFFNPDASVVLGGGLGAGISAGEFRPGPADSAAKDAGGPRVSPKNNVQMHPARFTRPFVVSFRPEAWH